MLKGLVMVVAVIGILLVVGGAGAPNQLAQAFFHDLSEALQENRQIQEDIMMTETMRQAEVDHNYIPWTDEMLMNWYNDYKNGLSTVEEFHSGHVVDPYTS